jgi:hypothetical protein
VLVGGGTKLAQSGFTYSEMSTHAIDSVATQFTQDTNGGISVRFLKCSALVLALSASALFAEKKEHVWSIGKVLDEGRARTFIGMYNNSSSSTSTNGSVNGTANSSTYGSSTSTNYDGNYSGNSTTSSSGLSTPIYKVYDNLVVEGSDMVYVTSERLRWRWSKGAHVAVNGEVKYYAEGRKLHLLDDDGKEHSVDILKEIRKPTSPEHPATQAPPSGASLTPAAANSSPAVATASVSIDSTPSGADIEIDSSFVGNTPSAVQVASGPHTITVKKKGFADWTRNLNVTGGNVHVNAELDSKP